MTTRSLFRLGVALWMVGVIFDTQTIAAAPTGVLRFKRLHVRDDLMECEAYSLLVPADWKADGGVTWRRNPLKPATAALRVTSPDGKVQFEILPQMPFVDGAREAAMRAAAPAGAGAVGMMAQRFAEGQLCYGNEVRQRIEDPAAFVRDLVLPRCRGDLRELKIVKEEPMPAIAEALSGVPADEGTNRTIRAGRTRIEFAMADGAYEEDIYCVLVLVEIPMIRQTYWGGEQLIAFRAPKGTLDANTPIGRTIATSFRLDLNWYNKYVQVVGSMIQGQIHEIQAVGEFSRRWAQMSDQVSTDRQKSWEDQQARQDEMNRKYSQYQRGLEDYRDANGNRVELPSGYTDGWISRGGEAIVTENPNFNPNVELGGDWTRLEKVP